MADDNKAQQNQANPQNNQAQKKPQEGQQPAKNEREGYAKKMWQQIEKKASMSADRAGLKNDVQGGGSGGGGRKRRRRRKRRRPGDVPGQPLGQNQLQTQQNRPGPTTLQHNLPQESKVEKQAPGFVADHGQKPNQPQAPKVAQQVPSFKTEHGPKSGAGQFQPKIHQQKLREQPAKSVAAEPEVEKQASTPKVAQVPKSAAVEPSTFEERIEAFKPEKPHFTAEEPAPQPPVAPVTSVPPVTPVIPVASGTPAIPVNPFAGVSQKVDFVEARKEPEKPNKNVEEFEEAKEVPVKEVEMPEQKEPQIKSAKKELSAAPTESYAEVVDVTPDAAIAGGQEFKKEFWTILEQAGFTKKRILIALLVLVLGIFVLVFFVFDGDEGGAPADEGEEVVVGEEVLATDIAGVESAYIFGLEYTPIEARPISSFGSLDGIGTAFALGVGEPLLEKSFVEDIELLRRMDNMFNTDVYALVNLSTDRRKALEDHIAELGVLLDDANGALERVDGELNTLTNRFNLISEQRDLREQEFFTRVDGLLGESAYLELEAFMELSEETASIRAQFSARQVVRDRLARFLDVLRPRHNDLIVNKEALIKGVRVFDVPDSDIDAIVPVE